MSITDVSLLAYSPKVTPYFEAVLDQRCTKEQAEQAFVESMKKKGSIESEEYLKQAFAAGFRFQRDFKLSSKAAPLIKALLQKSLTPQEAERAFVKSAREMGLADPLEELVEVFEYRKRKARIDRDLAHLAVPYARAYYSKECTAQEAEQSFIQYMREQGDSTPQEDLVEAFDMALYYEK